MSDETREPAVLLPLPRTTYRLEGDRAERYRQAAHALGARLEGDFFDVDRAGVCPELTRALEAAQPPPPKAVAPWIIVDPEQAVALHSSERFSFESELLDRLYEQGKGFLTKVAESEALAAFVHVAPKAPATLDDLSAVEEVRLELRTSSGSVEKLARLGELDGRLDRPENYLSREYVQSMVSLVVELRAIHGDLEGLSVPPLSERLGAVCA
ncbi:MAG: hypothetical protein HY303_19295, partial [Candidatus Wallbacteria bacterium]|nr:hypothetical protein [Candidatus Wallbacteria bacterium]